MGNDNKIFTSEECSYIERKLNYIIFGWAEKLLVHIITEAQNRGIKVVYMNTSETLSPGANNDKVEYFYERLPLKIGFKKESAVLRNGEEEVFWAYHFENIAYCNSEFIRIASRDITLENQEEFTRIASGKIAFENIPQKYQGAFINILGRKPFYSKEEAKLVFEKIEERISKPKSSSGFYYDWDSKTWSGGQRFRSDRNEIVLVQKLPSEVQDYINNDKILLKFWSFLLSQYQHFGNDTIGFALICQINNKIWVINEIQTDCINHYLKIRPSVRPKDDTESKVGFDTIKDMLVAQNKSNWIPFLETNIELRNQIISNPNIIQALCDNTVNIKEWISQQREGVANNDIAEFLRQASFSKKCFLIG